MIYFRHMNGELRNRAFALAAILAALLFLAAGLRAISRSGFPAASLPAAPSAANRPASMAPQATSTSSETASTTAAASSTPASGGAPAPIPKPPAAEPPASQPAPSPAPQSPALPPDELNARTRAALVNILCTTRTGGYFEPVSGSGVIIDPRGIVLTNAHVGQYFLLRDFPSPGNVNCIIRTGSPARAAYTAILLYLPPAWVEANASQIAAAQPMGTGENDYSFLLITGTTNPNGTLPASFSYAAPDTSGLSRGQQMLLASYPAGFLGGITIEKDLYPTSAYATIEQIFAFSSADSWVDLFSVPGTTLSQPGSSGGAAVRLDGTLAGILVTSTVGTTTADRDLRAVTVDHIDHSLNLQGRGGISGLLSGEIYQKALDFNESTAPALTEKLVQALLNS